MLYSWVKLFHIRDVAYDSIKVDIEVEPEL